MRVRVACAASVAIQCRLISMIRSIFVETKPELKPSTACIDRDGAVREAKTLILDNECMDLNSAKSHFHVVIGAR